MIALGHRRRNTSTPPLLPLCSEPAPCLHCFERDSFRWTFWIDLRFLLNHHSSDSYRHRYIYTTRAHLWSPSTLDYRIAFDWDWSDRPPSCCIKSSPYARCKSRTEPLVCSIDLGGNDTEWRDASYLSGDLARGCEGGEWERREGKVER